MTYDSIQAALLRVTTVQESVETRHGVMDQSLQDIQLKIDTLQEEALKHGRLTNDTLAKEIARAEKIMSTMDVFVKSSLSELKKDLL